MNPLDLALLIGLAGFAFAGYRQGFLIGAFGFAGFLAGGVLAMVLVPTVLPESVGPFAAALAVGAVLAAATVGQVLAALVGSFLRSRVRWQPARTADAAGGALVSVCAVLLVAWFLATAVVQGPFPGLSREVRDSRVLTGVDSVMPDRARELFADFRSAVDDTAFPQVFGAFSSSSIVPVDEPDAALLADPDVKAAKRSVVEVSGTADSCREQITGTGFVVAPGRVVTNAHVVAGVDEPTVRVAGLGFGVRATVVHFDPRLDLAVLSAPDLDAPSLSFSDESSDRGDPAVVVGFPGGSAYTAVPARVRGVQQARGRDIYDRSAVSREVYAVRSSVRPGDSGGPLLLPDGTVAGVVFAASVDDPDTGYALTAGQVADGVRTGVAADSGVAVDTGPCT
jgi:S1-C subfamily serine protease